MIATKNEFFELIESVLFITSKGIKETGLSVSYYWNLSSEGSEKTMVHPKNKKLLLAKYELLSQDHQQKIQKRFGNPYDFIARCPILKMLKHDDQAEQFFLSYRYNDDKILPIKRIKQYTRAACWLNVIRCIDESKNNQLKELGIKIPEFYKHLDALMQSEKVNGLSETYDGNNQLSAKFPTSYRNLRQKLDDYIKNGYASLIDKMYGNQLAAKINDEVSEAQLLTLIENPTQYDDVMVAFLYNLWAKENKYDFISPATVGVWRRKKEPDILMGREGNNAFNEKYIRQVKGFRPSSPLYLVEHDDNNLDFLFADTDGYKYHKYVSIVVKDSYCDLLLGKSYRVGQTPEQEQIHHAYIDAMYYIRSLTGGWYMPFELKSDRWASKSLTPFYESIGKFVPPAHGNKHRGYIEQTFASNLWKRAQRLVSEHNWSGNNVTAKYPGVNREWLDSNASNRPLIGSEAELQIEKFFYMLRHMPDIKRTDMNAPCKEQKWLQAWQQLTPEQKRPITDEQFLLTFGIAHQPKHTNGIKITNRGVEPQICNKKFSYDLPESWMYSKYIGARVEVVYDPFDMSRVLITNNDDIRFIATTAQLTPRALKDHYTSSRTYLNAILDEKGQQVERISKAADKRRELADKSYFNAEAVLQGGALDKELKNHSEQVFIERPGMSDGDDLDPLDRM